MAPCRERGAEATWTSSRARTHDRPGRAERVARAVSNVVDNARKWIPRVGVVEISLRDGVLAVRDHGPGFSQEDLPHVFDRFYRAHDARSLPGSGLGLAIVRQAAESSRAASPRQRTPLAVERC